MGDITNELLGPVDCSSTEAELFMHLIKQTELSREMFVRPVSVEIIFSLMWCSQALGILTYYSVELHPLRRATQHDAVDDIYSERLYNSRAAPFLFFFVSAHIGGYTACSTGDGAVCKVIHT